MRIQDIKYLAFASTVCYVAYNHTWKVIYFSCGALSYHVYLNIKKIRDIYEEAVFQWHEITPWRYHRYTNPHLWNEDGTMKNGLDNH